MTEFIDFDETPLSIKRICIKKPPPIPTEHSIEYKIQAIINNLPD